MKAVPGHRYRHYKGKEYVVFHIVHHSETLEEMVIYEAQYNSQEFGDKAIWARPRKMFEEKLNFEGALVERFTEV